MESKRGHRLLPQVLDELAIEHPNGPIIRMPKTSLPSEGYEEISYSSLANAVNRAAHWLKNSALIELGSVIAYLGPSDARYTILLLAALKLDAVMFFPSPHNAPTVMAELLGRTNASILLFAGAPQQSKDEVIEISQRLSNIFNVMVPDLSYFLDTALAEKVPFTRTMESVRSRPFVILHTSGTTGTPKPLALPHGYYIHEDLNQDPCFDGNITSEPYTPGARLLTSMSMWHVGGIFYGLLKPILNGIVTVMPPPGLPITADLLASCLTHSKADMIQAAPSLLEELISDAANECTISALNCIITGSGPMSEAAGKRLISLNPKIYNYFGLTETDLLPQMALKDPKDWQYQSFHTLSGVAFRSVGDGLYELIIVKTDEGPPQPCFEVCPGSDVFHTKDLFAHHPTRPDLWKWVCRLDDIVTLSTGEKMVAMAIEQKIMQIEGVKAALIVGQGRRRPALFLEIGHEYQQDGNLALESLWPYIDAINSSLPVYGRFERGLIAIATSPFPRTPKGTIKRHEAQRIFEARIQELYDEHGTDVLRGVSLDIVTEDDVVKLITTVTSEVLDVELGKDADIFAASGIDSMSLMRTVRLMNRSLETSSEPAIAQVKVLPSLFYAQRTVGKTAKTLFEMIRSKQKSTSGNDPLGTPLARLLHEATTALPRKFQTNQELSPPDMRSVVLTGSTGFLGPYILHRLLHDEEVRQIVCINRSHTAREQHLSQFPIDKQMLSKKASFHQSSDLSQPHLGVAPEAHQSLLNHTTAIIHNAWPVNFQLPLIAFKPHIKGVVSLIELASVAVHKPQIVFISSLGSVSHCGLSRIPETVIDNSAAAGKGGYAQSKWIAEAVLKTACDMNVISTGKVVRPGDIAGPISDGIWNPKQAIPSLIISSEAIGSLPTNLGGAEKIRWIPVDACAEIIKDLAEAEGRGKLEVYNVINIQEGERTWSEHILPAVKQYLEDEKMKVVSFGDWIKRVEEYGPKAENPAFKLLEHYESLASAGVDIGFGGKVDVERAERSSQAMKELGHIEDVWVKRWIGSWGL